ALPARSGACWPQRWRSPWRTGGSSPPRSGACSAWRPGHQWASSASSRPGCWDEWATMRSRWPGWRRGWWWPESQAADRGYRPQRARSTLAAAFPGPVPIPGPIDAGLRVAASSVAAVERLELADQGAGHLRTVAVKHARVIRIEQRVFDAREALALAALDHDGVLRVDHVEDRHAVDRAGRIGLRHRIDHVVGADHQADVRVLELGIDVVHVRDQ